MVFALASIKKRKPRLNMGKLPALLTYLELALEMQKRDIKYK
jgi:hypothetical protein